MKEREEAAIKTAPNNYDGTKVDNLSVEHKRSGQNFKKLAEDLTAKRQEVEERKQEYATGWRKYLHDFSNSNIARPEFLLKIGGIDVMPRHELTTITGKAGQGKSYLNIIIMGALLKGEPVLNIVPLRPVQRILYVDTEQSEYDVAERSNAVFRAMGWQEYPYISDDTLRYLRLRTADSNEERAEITKLVIDDFHPDVVFLDGLTDFVVDLDDKNEAHDIVASYLKMIDTTDSNVIATIHQNEGSDNGKLREFVGSEIMRKSRTIITVSVQDGYFTAKPQKGRPFTYNWRINQFGDLTTTIVQPPTIADENERYRLEILFNKLTNSRTRYDSKKQLLAKIGEIKGTLSEKEQKRILESAEEMEIISVRHDGHKYYVERVKTGKDEKQNNCE